MKWSLACSCHLLKRLAINSFDLVPHSVWVKKHGAVIAFEQLRRLGSQTSVGFLIDLLAPGIITAQGYCWLAFALKYGSRLSHTMLERMTSAKQVEFVEESTGALTNTQFNNDRSQAFEKIGAEEWRYVVKYFNWWQLRVVAAKEHKIAMERELGEYVQERSLCHKYLVDAKRRVEETLLDSMLHNRESASAVSNWRLAT